MASSSSPPLLSTLSEASSQDDEPRPHSPPRNTSQNPRRLGWSRALFSGDRRRADSDTATAGASSSSARPFLAHFNPEAVEFVPGSRMPPKRKASSSARPGKSVLMSPYSNGSQPTVSPVIRAEDIFGKDSFSQNSSSASGTIVDDDERCSNLFDWMLQDEQEILPRRQELLRSAETLSLIRSRVGPTTELKPLSRPTKSFTCTSAILFTCERSAGINEGTSGSNRLRYLPLQSASGRREVITKDSHLTIVPSHRERIDDTSWDITPSNVVWPRDHLPVEIFELIMDSLSRDDVKSMRLVDKEFEKKVSRTLFNVSVVPFNTELYDMIEEDTKYVNRVAQTHSRSKTKGKSRACDQPEQVEGLSGGLQWQNAKEDAEGKVYKGHGLRVFRGFGPHIRKFGMSFEVTEDQLARTPVKKEFVHVESYFGSYDWPHYEYTRFAGLAGLERTADDTRRMKIAFSNLKKVQDLALSIDSGLGWLNGPDKSVRAQIFDRPSPIFGHSWNVLDRQAQEARDFWDAMTSSARAAIPQRLLPLLQLHCLPLAKAPSEIPELLANGYANPGMWHALGAEKGLPSNSTEINLEDMRQGVLFTTTIDPGNTQALDRDKFRLVPSELRKEQKEWLLETEWAQRAFLECYILAIMDNPTIFGNVKTLKLAKISSGFLPLLGRPKFWSALPTLSDVTVHVKPDWRSVERDNAGYAEVCNQNPSEAAGLLYSFILRDRICQRPSITKVNVGWVGGGEYAEGLFARNTNILPAPITPLDSSDARHATGGLVFNFVEHLTLTNCWLTPPALEELVANHAGKAMKTLTLDSVSLTSHPRFPADGQVVAQPIPVPVGAVPHPGGLGPANLANQNQNGQAPQWVHNWLNQNLNGQAQPAQPLQAPHAAQVVQAAQQLQLPAVHNTQNPAPQAGWLGLPPGFINALQVHGMNQQQIAHVHQQMYHQFIANNQNAAPVGGVGINANTMANPIAHSHWSEGHREGSWPQLLDTISPGRVFTDYFPPPAPWEEQLPARRETNLQSIEFKSCGYARLINSSSFDQDAMVRQDARMEAMGMPVFFRGRRTALSREMMTTNDRYIGRVVQHIPQRELDALLFAWGLTEGWARNADEPEYDGMLPGGTGRFSGRIDKGV